MFNVSFVRMTSLILSQTNTFSKIKSDQVSLLDESKRHDFFCWIAEAPFRYFNVNDAHHMKSILWPYSISSTRYAQYVWQYIVSLSSQVINYKNVGFILSIYLSLSVSCVRGTPIEKMGSSVDSVPVISTSNGHSSIFSLYTSPSYGFDRHLRGLFPWKYCLFDHILSFKFYHNVDGTIENNYMNLKIGWITKIG